MDRIPVVAVVGPTASGKTALAVELCRRLNGEVISADSMQIYRGMDIATAKPTDEEMRGVRHHLIDFVQPGEEFSVARYCELAHPIIKDISARGALPVIAGGTGLYIDSLLSNVRFSESDSDPELRARLQTVADSEGVDALLSELREFDPESADELAAGRNPKRIIRAIEMYRVTGMTRTQLNKAQTSADTPYRALRIGLRADDRAFLYDRIDRRVDDMLARGLIGEARRFYSETSSATASAAIGYKELKPYLDGRQSLDECADRLKRATRRYAKRQLTWFSRGGDVRWFSIDTQSFDEIADKAEQIIKDFLYD